MPTDGLNGIKKAAARVTLCAVQVVEIIFVWRIACQPKFLSSAPSVRVYMEKKRIWRLDHRLLFEERSLIMSRVKAQKL